MTTYHSDDCSSSLHDYCNRCECECHGFEFTKEEVESLWRILSHHYVSYEDMKAIEVTRKIAKLIDEILAR